MCPKNPRNSSVQNPNLPFPPNLIKGKKDLVMFLTDEGRWWHLPTKVSWEPAKTTNEAVDQQDL